jgi:hypothetical protein
VSTPSTLDYKAISATLNVDEAQGVIECFAAAIGNKDSVGDIILPGAFTASLKRRNPRVVWGHNWNEPIGKVLEIYEVAPNDPRLPPKMKAAGVGGLYAKTQFNLKSERGRQAFLDVQFFGADQEWCVDPATEILTQRGWLRYDEVTTDDEAYVLDPELGWGKFEPIEAVNVWEAKERSLRHIETDGHSSLTTAAHRWPLADNTNGGNVRWSTTEQLDYQDRIIRAAPRFDAPPLAKYDDSFIELVGWFWTEGWVPPAAHPDAGLYIAQSTKVNPQHVASIRAALEATFPGEWSEAHSADDMARFRLTRSAAEQIQHVTGAHKEATPEFLLALTRSQLKLLIDVCLAGDGHITKSAQSTWYQVADAGVRSFEMLCALAGQPTVTKPQKDYGNRYGRPPQRVSLLRNGVSKPLDSIRVKEYNDKPRRTPAIDEWETSNGIVWCPTTPSGTWLARRDGTVYFTGNSIGYKTLVANFSNEAKANLLSELELYEISPVLHGANQLTALISLKDAMADGGNDIPSQLTAAVAAGYGDSATVLMGDAGSVVFSLPDGDSSTTYQSPYTFTDGAFVFQTPQPVRLTTVVEPICMPDMACALQEDGSIMGDPDGDALPEGDIDESGVAEDDEDAPLDWRAVMALLGLDQPKDAKAGRVLSRSNLDKVQQAATLLQDVLSSTGAAAMQMKLGPPDEGDNSATIVGSAAAYAAAAATKSLGDPAWVPIMLPATTSGVQLHVVAKHAAHVAEMLSELETIQNHYGLGVAAALPNGIKSGETGIIIHLPRRATLGRDTAVVMALLADESVKAVVVEGHPGEDLTATIEVKGVGEALGRLARRVGGPAANAPFRPKGA